MSFIVFVSITPLDKGESVGPYVSRAVDVIDRSGLDYILTPMGTIIEGPGWEPVMGVVHKAFDAVLQDCRRVSITIKGDYRKGRKKGLTNKVKSIEQNLGRTVRTKGAQGG